MMKITTLERWEEDNITYTELRLGKYEACCVKEKPSGLRYVLECDDGNDAYSYIGGADFPLRKLTDKERKEVIDYIGNIKDCLLGSDYMEDIIQQWKREALGIRGVYKDTTVFHVDGNTLYLITKYPGLFIGYHGNLVNKYKEKLGMKVEIIELRDGITRF